jgi:hypothetical protein
MFKIEEDSNSIFLVGGYECCRVCAICWCPMYFCFRISVFMKCGGVDGECLSYSDAWSASPRQHSDLGFRVRRNSDHILLSDISGSLVMCRF